MYFLPQEVEVWYVIPTIRKEIAKILTKKYKMTFDKAGEAIGVSKAAISQYFSKKRAKAVKFPKEIKKEIEGAAKRIYENPNSALKEMMNLLREVRKMRFECILCKKYNKGISKQCSNITAKPC